MQTTFETCPAKYVELRDVLRAGSKTGSWGSSDQCFVAKCGQEAVGLFRNQEDCEFFVWARTLQSCLREPGQQDTVFILQRLIEGMVE